MTDEENKIDCKSLMINITTGTGYWFCKEKGSLRVDEEYCKNCIRNKELKIECEKGNSNFWLRIANYMGKYRK